MPPVLTLATHLTEDPGNEFSQQTHTPEDETSSETTTITKMEGTVHSETLTNAVYTTQMLTTNSAVTTSQHTNVPAVMTAHTGNQDEPACTVASFFKFGPYFET